MNSFLARRAQDPRFANERRVGGVHSTSVTNWYTAFEPATKVEKFTFSMKADSYSDASSKDNASKKSRKMKRKKGSEEFTEEQKEELRNRDSSDNSDSGG